MMKAYPEDQKYFSDWAKDFWKTLPEFSSSKEREIKNFIQKERHFKLSHPLYHSIIESLPFIILGVLWFLIIFFLPKIEIHHILKLTLMGILHGIWGYSWVIYTLHEGGGHQLLKGTIFRKLAFHSSRLLFADPVFYKSAHKTHHQFLGTDKDASFTQFVNHRRFLKSLLPGAGILFPNDYKIHQGDNITSSLVLSHLIGGLFLGLEIYLLRNSYSWWEVLISFALLGPWIGFSLDRLRESIEHWGMPAHRHFGSKEFGLGLWGLMLGGGPWGQPCHFSHHLAPDLSWYQQLKLHFFLKKMNLHLPEEFLLNEGLSFKIIIKRIFQSSLPARIV